MVGTTTDKIAFPPLATNGIPFERRNDDEFERFLQELLTRALHQHPELLNFARDRAQAWRRAYALVTELERRGLLRGGP
jgi:hypothetical protein